MAPICVNFTLPTLQVNVFVALDQTIVFCILIHISETLW